MTEFWNPYTTQGENPFPQFPTWAEFITHYAVPKNVINRKKGPGDAVGEGEWYLTLCGSNRSGDVRWFLSYVGTKEEGKSSETQYHGHIRFIAITDGVPSLFYEPPDMSLDPNFKPSPYWTHGFQEGHKDSWGMECIQHYKVDISDVKRFTLINWTEDPFLTEK